MKIEIKATKTAAMDKVNFPEKAEEQVV